MKAALWHARDDVRVEEVPEPGAPGPDEVIIRVSACGICGTDLEEYRAGPLFIPVGQPNPLTGRQAPIILGHEFAGEVVEVGRGVTRLRAGDRVAPDVLVYCGKCYWCQRHQVMLCEQMGALTEIGPDVVIDASGAVPATLGAIDAARRGGRIVVVALPLGPAALNFMAIVSTEKEIIGSLSHVYDEEFAAALQFLADGR